MAQEKPPTQSAKPTAGRRKVNPALLAILGMAVLGLVVVLVAGGGGGSQQAAQAPAPVSSPSVEGNVVTPGGSSGEPTPSPSASTFELSESRDPFQPLIVPPPEGAAAAAPAATPTAAAASPEAGAAGAPAPAGGEAVELLDVVDDQGTTKAQVKVGSTVSTVAAGETFSSTYTLVSVQGACATMRNADDEFTLCTGDQVLK